MIDEFFWLVLAETPELFEAWETCLTLLEARIVDRFLLRVGTGFFAASSGLPSDLIVELLFYGACNFGFVLTRLDRSLWVAF